LKQCPIDLNGDGDHQPEVALVWVRLALAPDVVGRRLTEVQARKLGMVRLRHDVQWAE
jgi:hypothetical protein